MTKPSARVVEDRMLAPVTRKGSTPAAVRRTCEDLLVDVEGYRTRREESLIGLAERIGRQVARSRRALSSSAS
jgi:hypothetical protein